MHSRKRLITGGLLTILAAGLGACSASADWSYSEYRSGPGYQNERTYGSRVYGDTRRGLGAENCRLVRRTQLDAFGQPSSWEEAVCEQP
ncbi:hypothetical protein [Microvirga sp. P5_D2]